VAQLKYEEVYLKAYKSMREARDSLGRSFDFYNGKSRHQSLERMTPDAV
jgi:putative transposase